MNVKLETSTCVIVWNMDRATPQIHQWQLGKKLLSAIKHKFTEPTEYLLQPNKQIDSAMTHDVAKQQKL